MRHKKLMAMALVAAMMTGTFAAGVPAFATETDNSKTTIGGTVNNSTEEYTLTIPSDTTNLDLTTTTAQTIGSLNVKLATDDASAGRSFDTTKQVEVEVTSANGLNLKNTAADSTEKIAYTLKADENSVADGGAVTFAAADITATGTSVAMSVAIADADAYKSVSDGTYQDVLTFKASLENAETEVQFFINDASYTAKKGQTIKELIDDGTITGYITSGNGFAMLKSDGSILAKDGTYVSITYAIQGGEKFSTRN